jgi:DnaJ-class molecular chaperone
MSREHYEEQSSYDIVPNDSGSYSGYEEQSSYDIVPNDSGSCHGNGNRDDTVDNSSCPSCNGSGKILHPHVGRPGEYLPCACTLDGQRFWDKA